MENPPMRGDLFCISKTSGPIMGFDSSLKMPTKCQHKPSDYGVDRWILNEKKNRIVWLNLLKL